MKFFILMIFIIIFYFIVKKKLNKNKCKICEEDVNQKIENAFYNNDFDLLYQYRWENKGEINIQKSRITEQELNMIQKILNINVKVADEYIQYNLINSAIYNDSVGYEKIKCSRVCLIIEKRLIDCKFGKKEFFDISIAKHYGEPKWINNDMIYDYNIWKYQFYALNEQNSFMETWSSVKKEMFNENKS